MSFNHAIVDDLRAKREPIPPEIWQYVDPDEIDVRTKKPKWTWVARVCHEIPVGKCVMIPVHEDYKNRVDVFIVNLRSALSMSRATVMDKFSVRRSKLNDYVVVMKSGTWAKLYRDMES